ncbi:MAG TPA: SDR family oxidoreductase [Acidimicrobiales bacterium]|nr:SDR family oxidoreductase [Acidimicrobiales bacterium]
MLHLARRRVPERAMTVDFSEQRLADRVAIVTGGGYGIGRDYAHRLAAEGADVVIAELDAAAGDRVCDEIRTMGRSAVAIATDVANEQQVTDMVAGTIETFGKVDVLVKNAAMFTKVPVVEATLEDLTFEHFERVLRVNVLGTWLCARAVIPDMRRRSYGKIINVSSGTVFRGSAGTMLQYVTSKSALLGFTRSLARAVGPDGIRVNCVAPGLTMTDDVNTPERAAVMWARAHAERAIQRVETPGDLVGIIAFLASRDSDFIDGQTIVVDGGAFMH